MKTYTMPFQQNQRIQLSAGKEILPAMASSIKEVLALLSAVSAAAVVVLLSVWVAGAEVSDLLGAGTWGVGFVFLGLAVDNREPVAFLQLITGAALLILAWLGTFVSTDFVIASGLLSATWVAAGLFKYLR